MTASSFGKAKDTRTRIAVLWFRRDGSGFNKSKSHAEHLGDHFGVFIKPGGKADRIGKAAVPERDTKRRIGHTFRIWHDTELQGFESQLMRIFGIEAEEKRTGEGVQGHDHG